MKRFWGLIFFLTTVGFSSFAQYSIQGKVLDKKDEGAIEMANIRLLNQKDSAYIQGCQTDINGAFTLGKVKGGSYLMEIRFLGYNLLFKNVEVLDKSVILKNIYLEGSDNLLKEIQVTGMAAQMSVRNDTMEFNPAAFKTPENAAVEELLKKLPGFLIDVDGKITINGVEIKNVLVDGKKFFRGDIQMAIKNMPVDMIDKIQVVDQKSEMAQLTGFEDENTEKTINLTIKPNRKKGLFGNVTTGGGFDLQKNFRYNENAFLTLLNGNSQSAIVGGANNVNRQRSGRGREGMIGGSGITETQNIGVNNSTEVSKKLKYGGDITYNHSTNTAETSSERESWAKEIIRNNNNQSVSKRDNHQANMRFDMNWIVDSVTTLIVQPNIGFSRSLNSGNNVYGFFEDGDSISWGKSGNSNLTDNFNASLNVIVNRKLASKKGRSLTINMGGSFNNSDGEGQNRSEKTTQKTRTNPTIIDQQNTNTSSSYSANARLSYVEPLDLEMKNFLEVAVSARINSSISEKLQYNQDDNGLYNVLDSVYSNKYKNDFYNEAVELNFRHQEKKSNYMFGLKAEPSQTYSTRFYKNGESIGSPNIVANYSPTASYKYNFTKRDFVNVEYRGRTNQPSISQMQPVKNN
ncbi:MAG: carboxypeptidase-like regulatory domain-containing protein, partial [Bacteroidales bacterium]|nr:carboxypeptidase-like regulatory domain-containing protein [Bacteroidales bacterium]